MIKTIIINVIISAIFVLVGLGPLKLWKKMFLQNGDISWLWVGINSLILVICFIFIVTTISIQLKPYFKLKNNSIKKPILQLFVSDNLANSSIINSSGTIVYESLLTLSMEEDEFIEDLFIELEFPTSIHSHRILKQIGIKDFNITTGTKEALELKSSKLNVINKSIIINASSIKPGAYLRCEIESDLLAIRNVSRKIIYNGYFHWLKNGEKIRENITGEFNPKFTKLGSINTKSINELYDNISNLDSNEGTLVFWTNDSLWWKRNNYTIEFIPLIQKDNFKLRIFRDSDNIFKCLIKTESSNEAILTFDNFSEFPSSLHHPEHHIGVTWQGTCRKLYVDGKLVDEKE